MLRPGFAAAAGLLFPPVCLVCGRDLARRAPGIAICRHCRAEVCFDRPVCVRCARPLPVISPPALADCAGCRDKRFRFGHTTALGVYGGLLRELVIAMKQAAQEPLTMSVGGLLARRLRQHAPPDVIVPVPMHRWRRIMRGGNSPEVLAEVLARRLGVAAADDLLRCRRKTKKQGTLLPTERRANVRGAYAVSTGYDISDARVLLVDDVMTTGATANEIARLLRRAGARSVSVAVVARGVGFG